MAFKYLAVIDLEGTDLPDTSAILEMHCRLVDKTTLKERASFWALPAEPLMARPLNDFTRAMHTKNGLLARRRAATAPATTVLATNPVRCVEGALLPNRRRGLPTLAAVEDLFCSWLQQWHGPDGPKSIVLTGNSLANYDIPLLRRWMPRIFSNVHYRTYDVSVVRTHYREVLGHTLPPKIEEQINGTSDATHRAADDTAICLQTIRQLRAWHEQSYPAEPVPPPGGWKDDGDSILTVG